MHACTLPTPSCVSLLHALTFFLCPGAYVSVALLLISLLGNGVGTCALIGGGVWVAGLVTGVPAFPPGFVLPWAAS